MAGTLYVVATPIGNLEDITLRALRILREADLIAAEDTRVTRKLLSRYDVHTQLISYHEHSSQARVGEIADAVREGKSVALVTDAGTPGISDPGFDVITACIDSGLDVCVVPGACAFVAALVASGLPTESFAFDGFPPRKDRERAEFFRRIASDARTHCFYESPNRLGKTLKSIHDTLGDRRVCVSREITKLHEENFRGAVSEAIAHFGGEVRGEVVIVLEGYSGSDHAPDPEAEANTIREMLENLKSDGMSDRDAVRECVKKLGHPKNVVYDALLQLKSSG